MSSRTVLAVVAAVALTTMGVSAAVLATAPDPERAHELVQRLAVHDVLLNEHVLRVRYGVDESYDPITRDLLAERHAIGELEDLLRDAADPPLAAAVDGLVAWHLRQEDAATRFATANAVLRNSSRFLATLEDRLDQRPEPVRLAVANVSRGLLRFEDAPDDDLHDEIVRDLDALATLSGDDLELREYGRHARVALTRASMADVAVGELFELQRHAPHAEVLHRLEDRAQAAGVRDVTAEAGLAVAGGMLAAAVVLAGVRLRRSERRLAQLVGELRAERAKVEAGAADLERRVSQRTVELADANRQLADASRAKSDFLANMSHEIRTPMAAVQGYAELLLDPQLDASERLNHVLTIRRNGEHLISLINDILDLSKIEAGRMEVESIRLSPARVIVEVASLMRVKALEKGLEFQVFFVTPIPEHVEGDPTRMRQILLNLVGNAIKFTERGRVSVEAAFAAEPAPTLCVAVRDTGIGMSEGQAARLFQAFTQGDTSTTRRYGGTGLGLVICRQLARLMDGDIDLASRAGHGACFTLRVPTGPVDGVPFLADLQEALTPPSVAREPRDRPVRLGGRILLAEDGRDNQRLIATHLRRAGAAVTIAENGVLAVQEISRAEARGEPFDLVLMDMQMPELDGYGATAKLRARGFRTPVIALTAHAMVGDRERCLAAGCDDYLTKPVERARLLECVETWFERTRAASARPSPAADSNPALVSDYAGDPEVAELVEEFVRELPDRMHELVQAHELGDRDRLRRLAHQLKGSAGGYGFPQIGAAASALEDGVVAGSSGRRLEAEVAAVLELAQRAAARRLVA